MSRSRTLPAATTSFVGRKRQLDELVDLLAGRRLVTLTGAGGSGKTRLALEVARRREGAHRDGVRLVELAGLGNADLVPGAVLGALGMQEPPARTSATEALCAALADRALLLVLDNCEHVVSGVAALVNAVLPACAGLHVLATSREPLRVSGEVERMVPPLDRPAGSATEPLDRLAAYDAVRLLVERGSDVRPGFRLTDGNAAAVARICAALEGIPLAIELVAARLRTQSPEQLAARLGEQLDLLTDGGRTRPDRQQTMRATLDWSHGLLTPDEQTVFRRLSIFAGGFTLEAAADVAASDGVTEAQAVDAIERLASKSLIEIDHEREEPRLRMLEPVRQYAAERLRAAGERDELVRRHLDWAVRIAVRAGLRFMSEPHQWTVRLHDEHDNLRQALEASLTGVDREAALRIAAALGYPWYAMGQPDGRAWVVRALGAALDAPDLLRAIALLGAGLLEENALDHSRALTYLREALALFRSCGVRAGEAWTLMAMGRAAWWIDVDGRPARAWFEEALPIFREVGEQAGIGFMLLLLTEEAYWAGDVELAASQAAEALEIGTASGILVIAGNACCQLAIHAGDRGRHAEAMRLIEQAAQAFEHAGDRYLQGTVRTVMAELACQRGEVEQALSRLSEALRLARDTQSGERMAYTLGPAVEMLWRRGRACEAASLLGAVETRYLRHSHMAPWFRAHLGDVAAAVASAGLDAERIAGRSLSLERATDLALRVVDEELAAASAVEVREEGSAEGTTGTPRPAGFLTAVQQAGDGRGRANGLPGLGATLRREGDYWTLVYAGGTGRLKDMKGLHYLVHLLEHPDHEFHVLDLLAQTTNAAADEPEVRGTVLAADLPLLDATAKASYRRRLVELREDLAEAERHHDTGRAERARAEIDALTQQLAAAVGLGGRDRPSGSAAERARTTVTHRLRAVIQRIARQHPGLGDHLAARVRTGTFCTYSPDPERPIHWTLAR
jgi:non-specific serine/threonine protein kinase